jgi:hypothetical protein
LKASDRSLLPLAMATPGIRSASTTTTARISFWARGHRLRQTQPREKPL